MPSGERTLRSIGKGSGVQCHQVRSADNGRECETNSVSHPKLYDPAAMNLVKDVFREVWGIVKDQGVLVIKDANGTQRAAIIRKLIELVSEEVTDKDVLRAEALGQLRLN